MLHSIVEVEKISWETEMSMINKLSSQKIIYHSIASIMKNESTTFNNIQILKDIFERQFHISSFDSSYSSTRRLIFDDLKTWSRMQFVKILRQDLSTNSFDNFDWLISSLELWHLRLNFLQLIHRMHWDENQSVDSSTLQHAANRWEKSRVVKLNNFQALKDLIIHSYQARVIDVWIMLMKRQGFDPRRVKMTVSWLKKKSLMRKLPEQSVCEKYLISFENRDSMLNSKCSPQSLMSSLTIIRISARMWKHIWPYVTSSNVLILNCCDMHCD